jgi:hypothetical protein
MSFSRPIQWYHSHADPIWLDGTFKSVEPFPFKKENYMQLLKNRKTEIGRIKLQSQQIGLRWNVLPSLIKTGVKIMQVFG